MNPRPLDRVETSVSPRDEQWLSLAARAIAGGATPAVADRLAWAALVDWESTVN